ncbi:MAG: PDZ domain-containing protein [Methylacidiphilales bacterium]|nr:PDZ domain-containing protein [Candidatus Methylacidiphilales bacterium]
MRFRFWLPLILSGIAAPLYGQDEPIHMRPEFALTFPLAQNDKVVTVKYPVMINPTTVLKPGMVLRVMYILSVNSDDSSDLDLAHSGNMEESYARNAFGGAGSAQMPANLAHEIEGYRRTVWEVSNNFVLAMAQYPTDAMHLIYSPTGKYQDLHDERFNFFDGLLVGLPDGRVTVLAVEKESKADKAGIKAGDEIVSIGGMPAQNDLLAFAAGYAAAKKNASENEADSYPVTIRSAGKGDVETLHVAMPPKLKSGLMDGL